VFGNVFDFGTGAGGGGVGGHSEIVRQHTLPFISNMTFRACDPTGDAGAAGDVGMAAGGGGGGLFNWGSSAGVRTSSGVTSGGKSPEVGSPPHERKGGGGELLTLNLRESGLPPTSSTHPISLPPVLQQVCARVGGLQGGDELGGCSCWCAAKDSSLSLSLSFCLFLSLSLSFSLFLSCLSSLSRPPLSLFLSLVVLLPLSFSLSRSGLTAHPLPLRKVPSLLRIV